VVRWSGACVRVCVGGVGGGVGVGGGGHTVTEVRLSYALQHTRLTTASMGMLVR
jgi:hypothetical protein